MVAARLELRDAGAWARERLRDAFPRAVQRLDLLIAIGKADSFYRWSVLLAGAGAVATVISQLLYGRVGWPLLVGIAWSLVSIWAASRRYQHLRLATKARDVLARNSTAVITASGPVPFSQFQSAAEARSAGFAVHCEGAWSAETFERSECFDNHLACCDRLEYQEGPSELGDYFANEDDLDDQKRQRQLRYLITRAERKGTTLHNDAKFGLRMALEVPVGKAIVYKAGYYDALVTNEAFRSELLSKDRRLEDHPSVLPVMERLTEYFPFDVYEGVCSLKGLDQRIVANHVGVTTLALSSDHHLLFFRQSYDGAIGANLIVASGSGSVNYSDLRRACADGDLLAVLRYGMARELSEEADERSRRGLASLWSGTSLGKRIAEAAPLTIVTGFFRWVDRCGKPEFVGVTRLRASSADIKPDGKEVRDLGASWPIVRRMADFARARNEIGCHMKAIGQLLNLSAHVALRRICEIAGYAHSTDVNQRRVYKRVSEKLELSD